MPDYNPTNPASTIRGRLSIKRKHRSSLARLGSEQGNPKLLDQARDVMRRAKQKSQTHHSLKSPLCSCVSITLPAAS
jgi:hypothetical protein